MDWGTISETERDEWVDAAVLILCFKEGGEDHLLLTRRTEQVLHHRGQISFPGGAVDGVDQSLWETALRETVEEIGIDPQQVSFVKGLGTHYTPSGFRVAPFVGRLAAPPVCRSNPVEIAEVFTVPMRFFADRGNVRFFKKVWEGREFIDPHFTYEGREIWGVTGRILCEFFGIVPEV